MQEWEARVFEVALMRQEHMNPNVVRYIEATRDMRASPPRTLYETVQGERAIADAKTEVLEEQAAEVSSLRRRTEALEGHLSATTEELWATEEWAVDEVSRLKGLLSEAYDTVSDVSPGSTVLLDAIEKELWGQGKS